MTNFQTRFPFRKLSRKNVKKLTLRFPFDTFNTDAPCTTKYRTTTENEKAKLINKRLTEATAFYSDPTCVVKDRDENTSDEERGLQPVGHGAKLKRK